MTRYCPNCGSPLGEGQAFCGNCGTAAPSEADPSGLTMEMPPVSGDSQAEGPGTAAGQDFAAPTGPIFNTGVAAKASGMAIAALVLGIISIVTGPFFVGLVFGIIAIVLYVVSRKKHGKSGIGLAGLITGIVGTVISAITIVLVVLVVSFASGANVPADDYYPASQITEGKLVGTWHLEGSYFPQEGDESYAESAFSYDEASDFQAGGYGTLLTFQDDGTFTLVSGSGDEFGGSWDLGEYYVVLDFDDREADAFGYFYETDSYDADYDELSIVDSSLFLEFER